jgi:glutathione S-transferase
MILIGQYDSSFVRRVGIALTLYGIAFEHRPWSVFGDAEKIAELNPLTRVPTLLLDDGFVLVDSHSMIDHIDRMVEPARRLFPAEGAARTDAMKVAALATGLADKCVSLFYEQRLHESVSESWVARLRGQIARTLAALEADRAARQTEYWLGSAIGHADIAAACALRHLNDSLPDAIDWAKHPALAAHCSRCEALPVFQTISQPFVAPA